MIALAPAASACSTIISNASWRVRSHSSVKSVMLPPNSVCSEPPMVPKMLRDRTVIPRTTPMRLDDAVAVERERRGREAVIHAQAARSSEVHCGQRVAPTGIGILQYGQSFVWSPRGFSAGIIRLAARTMRNTAKAMIRKVMMLLMNTP